MANNVVSGYSFRVGSAHTTQKKKLKGEIRDYNLMASSTETEEFITDKEA